MTAKQKPRRPRKLTAEKAAAINRKRDMRDGTERSIELQVTRVRAGRGITVTE